MLPTGVRFSLRSEDWLWLRLHPYSGSQLHLSAYTAVGTRTTEVTCLDPHPWDVAYAQRTHVVGEDKPTDPPPGAP